jgi:hypothetical protein
MDTCHNSKQSLSQNSAFIYIYIYIYISDNIKRKLEKIKRKIKREREREREFVNILFSSLRQLNINQEKMKRK